MPNTFYRARLKWTEGGSAQDVIAVTLPGTPAAATGSNGRVAWAPTNANLDVVDQIALDVDPDHPDRYRVPGGWAEFEKITERIEVHGAPPVDLAIRWTRWGHVPDTTVSGAPYLFAGKPVAYRHILHSPEAINLRYFDLMLASDADEALRIGAESGGPVLNLVVGDRAGKVGWTVTGRLPRRMGQAGSQIVSWADGANGWNGWLSPDEHPRIQSPEIARIYSGNQRKLGSEVYMKLADAAPVLGVRARQLRDGLAGLNHAQPADMLAVQLDDRALLLEPWRQLLLTTLRQPRAAEVITNNLAEIVRYVADWNGRATPDSVGYRLLRDFRMTVFEYVFEPLTARSTRLLGTRVARFESGAERPVWALLKTRPPHLLNARFSSYDDLLLAAISDVVRQLRAAHGGDLGRATWGRHVTLPIQHPFSQALPFLSRWLDAGTEGCSGGENVPRDHGGGHGAVERLVVSPGHEDQGIFHMPGGQSGHFLSPYYRAGHEAWVHGKTTPLLPGPARHTLTLSADGGGTALNR
jgi:penicillin amidase